MGPLLALSRGIDRMTEWLGRHVAWLIVAAILVGAGNAVIRKAFDQSSNAWLELQWWMFGAVFLLVAPWTLKVNEHIRIDVLSSRLPRRARHLIDVAGHALFLLPVTAVVLVTSWPFFLRAYLQNEQSANAGGLPQWPAKFLIPLAFALLMAQGLSELVKRIAILTGDLGEDGGPPTRSGGTTDDGTGAGPAA
jgi:TRAP-type mannitol/chloroaromatic compound transport system permease small subunit